MKAAFLQGWSSDRLQQHFQGSRLKGLFLGFSPDLLSQTLGPAICGLTTPPGDSNAKK